MLFKDCKTSKFILWGIWLTFIALSLFIAPFHEPWADEIQAFLIARDADWRTIFVEIPYQEGQPVLWHMLLKLLLFIFGDSLNITYVSISIMAITVWLMLFKLEIPLIYKLLLPFGQFFLYQYNIIARNYCLTYLAFVLLAVFYQKRFQSLWGYALTLLLLAESTSLLAPVAAVLGGFWLWELYFHSAGNPKKYILPVCLLVVGGLSILWQILPLNRTSYELRRTTFGFSFYRALVDIPEAFFAGPNILFNFLFLTLFVFYSIKAVTRIDFYIYIKNNMQMIILMVIIWILFMTVYALSLPMFYHQGLIWGLFLATAYMFFPNDINGNKHYLVLICAFMQIYWGGLSIVYDIKNDYSSQYRTLNFLKEHNLLAHKIQMIGYHTLPLQALLRRDNLYISDDTPLFWCWNPEDMAEKNNPQKLLDKHYPIVVLDELEIAKCDLSYYENNDVFDKQRFFAASVYKGHLLFEHSVRLYISRPLLTDKN